MQYSSGPCFPSSSVSKCSLHMWISIARDHSLSLACGCYRAKRWPGSHVGTARRPQSVKFARSRLWVASQHINKVTPHLQDSGESLSSEEQKAEPVWAHLHRLGRGAAGVILGVALIILSNGEGYASAEAGYSEGTVVVDDGKKSNCLELEIHGSNFHRSLQHNLKPALDLGNNYSRNHVHYLLDAPAPREVRPGVLFWSRKAAISPHLDPMPLSIGRKGALHEGFGESLAIDYGQFVQGRDDMAERSSMFTKDAWLGMMRLKRYSELVEQMEAEEKLCTDCTLNRRLLE